VQLQGVIECPNVSSIAGTILYFVYFHISMLAAFPASENIEFVIHYFDISIL
jgi:hypothetical protein